MKRPGKASLVAGILGIVAYLLVSAVLPWALVRMGMSPRVATGPVIEILLFIGPIGLLAFVALGMVVPGLGLPGTVGWLVMTGLPSIVNGLAWGALAEVVAWARVRARWLFWVLVLGLGGAWAYALITFIIEITN